MEHSLTSCRSLSLIEGATNLAAALSIVVRLHESVYHLWTASPLTESDCVRGHAQTCAIADQTAL